MNLTMHRIMTRGLALIVMCATLAPAASIERLNDRIILRGDNYTMTLDAGTGSIIDVRVEGGVDASIWRSGESGLWSAQLADDTIVHAANFDGSLGPACEATIDRANHRVVLRYAGGVVDVDVTIEPGERSVTFDADVTGRGATVMRFSLPGRLRFDPSQVERFVTPATPHDSVGVAWAGRFFAQQDVTDPAGWTSGPGGPQGLRELLGNGAVTMRDVNDELVPLAVTEAGRDWLGGRLADRVARSTAMVNRATASKLVDRPLIESANGVWFGGSAIGEGSLWRFGGRVQDHEARIVLPVSAAVIERLGREAGAGRARIGLIDLKQGPPVGAWADVRVDDWRDAMRAITERSGGRIEFVALRDYDSIDAAIRGDEYITIVNPYGEWFPASDREALVDRIKRVKRYIAAGGNWFEVGGYSCYAPLRPTEYFSYEGLYPPMFVDWVMIESRGGHAALHREQARTWSAWAGADDITKLFTPGEIAFGGDAGGGYCDRTFVTYITAGSRWRSPRVRMTFGDDPLASLRKYALANGVTRRLDDKLPADLLNQLKGSVLLKYNGSAAEKLANLEHIPRGTLVHFSDYLHGGFDKQYPDHLPPHPSFGSGEQLRELIDRCRERGLLVMPYTNATWWCDEPKGPTFEREGEAPLLKQLDGSLSEEHYASNSGFTVTHWHPAVQQANRHTREQFTAQYPVDVLFQDQNGARRWRYDMNPVSPTPTAYIEGLLSQVDEDSKVVPLSTEDGWDQAVRGHVQLCGLAFGLAPVEHGRARLRLRDKYPPGVWRVYPVAQAIAHDKTIMAMHDLGHFVTNRRTMAWALGLGFNMSWVTSASGLQHESARQWLCWLDRMQKSVVSRYTGQPLAGFDHQWNAGADDDNDGVITTTYGEVRITANLSTSPINVGGLHITGYGYHAASAGLLAASLQSCGGIDYGDEGLDYIIERHGDATDAWLYTAGGKTVCIPAPGVTDGEVELTIDDAPAGRVRVVGGFLSVDLPGGGGKIRRVWRLTIR